MQTTQTGAYGISISHDDGRRDKTEAERDAERKADRITFGELLKQCRCDTETLVSITNLPNFPRPLGYKAGTRFNPRGESIYSKAMVNTFIDRQRALTASLPQRVK